MLLQIVQGDYMPVAYTLIHARAPAPISPRSPAAGLLGGGAFCHVGGRSSSGTSGPRSQAHGVGLHVLEAFANVLQGRPHTYY